MLNIEKYKKEVIARLDTCQMERMIHDITGFNYCGSACDYCTPCAEYVYKWLLSEYKEPILDDVESEYLSAVIRPFRNHVTSVRKWFNGTDYQIIISLDNADNLCQLPRFPLSSEMYKGMDSKKWYSLQELGL